MSCALAAVIIALIVKIFLMKRDITRLADDLKSIIESNTNALLRVESGDSSLKKLAEALNRELKTIRKLKIKLTLGDKKIKDAVTNISHDLRTPLTAISGYLELLQKEPQSGEAAKYIDIVRSRTEELSMLTEELFKYAVVLDDETKPELETVDVGELLEECALSFFTAFKERNIVPDIALSRTPVIKITDRQALIRIFSNIISNAIKYTDGDFSIKMDDSGQIIFSNKAETLNSVDVEKLFDRFFTVRSNRLSTGLGLSITRLLAERLGYKIDAAYYDGRLKIILSL